jgi:hypothetical protein
MPGAAEPADELAGLLRNRWSNSGEHGRSDLPRPPRENRIALGRKSAGTHVATPRRRNRPEGKRSI